MDWGQLLQRLSQLHGPVAGTWAHLPDFGVTEAMALEPNKGTPPPPPPASGPASYGRSTIPTQPTPITGGQLTGGGGGNGGNGGNNNGGNNNGGNNNQLSGPSPEEMYLSRMRDSFNGVKGAYESMIPTYDSDFNNYKTQTQGYVDQAKNTLGETNQTINQTYGDQLRKAIRANNELNQKTMGTYSALGSLDSSSYADTLTKNQQQLLENQNSIDTNKSKDLTAAKSQYDAYEQKALGDIQSYQNEIDRAKAGVRSAIANVNMQEAGSIANYLSQLQQNQANISNNLAAFKAQLAGLQAQGVNVMGNLSKINGQDFSNTFGNLLSGQINTANNTLQVPTNITTGQGYISPSGKRYNSYDDYIEFGAKLHLV